MAELIEETNVELPPPDSRVQMSIWQHLLMSGYWFGSNFVWGALLGVMLSSQMGVLAGTSASKTLGFLLLVGSICALTVPLVVGPLSDRCKHRWGRRRPYMLLGGIVSIVGMGVMLGASMLKSLPLFFVGFFILQFGSNTALASYSGVIPDLVPLSQRGLASGIMALMTQIGTLIGVITGAIFVKNEIKIAYGLLIVVFAVALLLTFVGVPEKQTDEDLPPINWSHYLQSLIDPLRSRDFAWVWLTRAMMMFGFYAIEPFILYYLEDVLHLEHAETESAKVVASILIAATFSGIVGGLVSDYTGRKPIVYLSSAIIAMSSIGFIFCHNLTHVLIVGLVFGLGYGAYVSVDWALGTDVLPSGEDAGKDMGVWHVSMTLPQMLAPVACGFILNAYRLPGVLRGDRTAYDYPGYVILFMVAAAAFGAGAYFVKNVKGAR